MNMYKLTKEEKEYISKLGKELCELMGLTEEDKLTSKL